MHSCLKDQKILIKSRCVAAKWRLCMSILVLQACQRVGFLSVK